MAINGNIQKQVTLTPSVVTTVDFVGPARVLSLMVMDGSKVSFKINGIVTGVSDINANFLNDIVPTMTCTKSESITSLTLVSNVGAVVQWLIE